MKKSLKQSPYLKHINSMNLSNAQIVILIGGVGAFLYTRFLKPAQQYTPVPYSPSPVPSIAPVRTFLGVPNPPPGLTPFFDKSEATFNLPAGMLKAQSWYESQYDVDAKGAAGEIGLMQIIPKWHPGVRAEEPREAISYAGSLLRKFHNEFETWEHALAAYNWGETNVRNKGINAIPASTRNYIQNILRAIGLSPNL